MLCHLIHQYVATIWLEVLVTSILSLEHWKNWFFNCNKTFLWRNKHWSSIFSDYFQVRYFQIFSISKTTTLRNFVPSAKDRENHNKKNGEKKIFWPKIRSFIFSNPGRAVRLQPQSGAEDNQGLKKEEPKILFKFRCCRFRRRTHRNGDNWYLAEGVHSRCRKSSYNWTVIDERVVRGCDYGSEGRKCITAKWVK